MGRVVVRRRGIEMSLRDALLRRYAGNRLLSRDDITC